MRSTLPLPLRWVALAALVLATPASGQLKREGISSLTDTEFWQVFTTMSEPGGTFPSENFISNEMSFQYPIPTLQKTVRPDGVYLGVGPEQNFTYIANLKPRLAIIFDIRRQNAMAHLMYKALFEMSPTRAEFVSKLFSRPLTGRVAPSARVDDLFAVATAAARSDSAYNANQHAIFANLVDKHRFVLTPGDSASIEHVFEVFYEAGPDVNYGYRLGRYGTSASTYPNYSMLQTRVNADSVQMAFLVSEDSYRVVRDMHVRNLIVPVVGDFAGPKAIRAVGDYLKQRSLTVQAFYLSNVEQYLFQNGVADRFYQNVSALPVDSTSQFIRSVPPGGAGPGMPFAIQRFGGGSGSMQVTITNGAASILQRFDSAGFNWLRTTQDSGGTSISRLYRDSVGVLTLMKTDSARRASSVPMPTFQPMPFGGAISAARPQGTPGFVVGVGLLTSGIASIQKTLADFAAGGVTSYQEIIQMTKLTGWK